MQSQEFELPERLRSELGGTSGKGVRIAVVDSGCDPNWAHLSFRPGIGLVDPEKEFHVKRSDDTADRNGHGTACIDILLRTAPGVEVYPVKVFDQRLETGVELLNESLKWSVEEGIRIVNFSLGTLLESSLRPLYRSCEVARRKGLLLISAINHATGWSYPAVFENAIGVEGAEMEGPFDFDYRPQGAAECAAKGGETVRWLGGRRQELFGSSFAAPRITGIVARLLEKHPGASLEQVRDLLRRCALRVVEEAEDEAQV